MKLVAVAAAFAATLILAVSTPAAAQKGAENKNAACVDKCNREAAGARGPMNAKSAGVQRGACIRACPNK
jgi:hypothetical protein